MKSREDPTRAAKVGNSIDQSRSLRSWSIYPVECETNCVYAFVLAYLELASAENLKYLRALAKENVDLSP